MGSVIIDHMQTIQESLLVLLAGYISLTNGLADFILTHFFDQGGETDLIEIREAPVTTLPSNYDDPITGLPRILLDNTAYQQASVGDSVLPLPRPASPLESLVNIFCTHTTETRVRTTTGSGFFVHPKGVILTNAHVAQPLLMKGLDNGQTICTIRTGNPAISMYTADLLYISPAWVQEHAPLLNDAAPRGTGERDYALLYVNGSTRNQSLPDNFPAIPLNTDPLLPEESYNATVRAAGYPASALTTEGTDAALRGIEVGTKVAELMTFGSQQADLFTIAGTEIGQQGSSGGPVVDSNGKAIGLITTRGDDEQFGNGSLRALTLSYIDRTIKEETGFDFVQNLNGDFPYRARLFRDTVTPFLLSILNSSQRLEQTDN